MKLIVLLLTFTSITLAKKPMKLTRDQKLMLLITQEENTINSVKKKTARLYYRYFELQNEKLKLIAKKENEAFIKARSADRDKFFKKTKKQYFAIKKLAYGIFKLKDHKRFVAPTFHALSLSCRDYKFEDKELKYINIALGSAPSGTELKYNIIVSKAEYLYNKKRYKQSYELYKRIVKNDQDQWFTKNLYIFGWTQFKTHRFDDSIKTLEKAYLLSKKKQYIDFREQVMTSLVVFYVSHSKIQEAIAFILKNDEHPTDALFNLARKASKKGFYNETNQVVKLIYEKIKPLKKEKYKKGEENLFAAKTIELKVFELEHFREYNKKVLFYKIVVDLENFKLDEGFKEETVNYITTEVSDLQQILKKGFNEQDNTYDEQSLKLCIYYFKRLRYYDQAAKEKYYFFSAETLFSVREYKRSIAYYKNAISTKDEFDLNKKSIDALYISIEEAKLAKKDYYKNLEYVYTTVIKLWPKEDSTKKVITNLFNLYFTLKNHKKMDYAIKKFASLFPKENKAQKTLFEKQIDLLIKQEDTSGLSKKLALIKSGFLNFPQKRAIQVEDILSTILFNRYKSLRQKGNNTAALKGYEAVYLKNDLPKKIKAQAALNIAIINTDLYNTNETIKWMDKTYKVDKNIYYQNTEIFLKLADRTLLFQDFIGASNMYRYHLERSCKDKKRNDDVLQKLISANIANSYTKKSVYYYRRYSKCASTKAKEAIKKEIISYLIDENDYDTAINYLKYSTFSEEEKFSIVESLYWKNEQSSFVLDKLKYFKIKPAKDFFEAKAKLALLNKRVAKASEFKAIFTKEMKPEDFNNKLNIYFTEVGEIINLSGQIVDLKNRHFTHRALALTQELLAKAKEKVLAIKSPLKDKNFNKSFYGQMKQLAMGFSTQAQDYKKSLTNFKNEYNILTDKVAFTVLSRAPSSVKTIDLEK